MVFLSNIISTYFENSLVSKKIISVLINLIIIILPAVSYFIITNNIVKADQGMYSISNNNRVNHTLIGEWELYYNDLIVTDNINRDYDALIDMPSSWEGVIIYGGVKLPKQGYASYRLVIDDLKPNQHITPIYQHNDFNMTVYFNRVKVASSGEVTKYLNDNGNDKFIYTNDYSDHDGVIEIIIEVSYNEVGGLNKLPIFAVSNYSNILLDFNIIGSIIVIIVFGLITIVEGLAIKLVKSSSFHTFLMCLAILGFYFTSLAFSNFLSINQIPINYSLMKLLNPFCYYLVIDATLYYIWYQFSVKYNKYLTISFFILEGIIGVLFIVDNVYLHYLAYILNSILILTIICTTIFRSYDQSSVFFFCIVIMSLAYAIFNLEFLYIHNIIKFPTFNTEIILQLFIFICFIGCYVSFIIRTLNLAYKSGEYLYELEQNKKIVLREQLKPHFIFNTLNCIKVMYRKNLDEGDKALNMFAKLLRTNLDTLENDLIPFNDELANLDDYITLENMRLDKEINVIYNIDYDDFLVPSLVLQPLVENILKHSGITNKEDGYLEISSYLVSDGIIIELEDNGKGFDINEVKEASKGLRNSKQRLELLLQATFTIKSKIDKGTSIIIKIPRERVRKDEDSYH